MLWRLQEMLVLEVKSVIIFEPVYHTVKDIFGFEFHFGDFAQDRFVHFGRVAFILFFHPDVHHLNSVFGVLAVIHELKTHDPMDLFAIYAAVF